MENWFLIGDIFFKLILCFVRLVDQLFLVLEKTIFYQFMIAFMRPYSRRSSTQIANIQYKRQKCHLRQDSTTALRRRPRTQRRVACFDVQSSEGKTHNLQSLCLSVCVLVGRSIFNLICDQNNSGTAIGASVYRKLDSFWLRRHEGGCDSGSPGVTKLFVPRCTSYRITDWWT